jgi:CubicO group peptidase (beta-lactamase class C family)
MTMTPQLTTPPLDGHCDPRFSRVKEAFAASLCGAGELGAAVALVVDGRPVVDLWGGYADRACTRPWTRDTVVNVYSVTKGLLAMCAHRLVEEGRVDLDAPVASVWPELAANGKERLTLRQMLAHRAGLPAIRATLAPEALFDWSTMTAALAAEAPWWEPGTNHGYHAVTFGWLVGEVIRRVTGTMPKDFLREALAGPLGVDATIGLDEAHDARCAELRPGRRVAGVPTLFDRIVAQPESMTAKAFTNPISMVMPNTASSRAWRDADLPSVNGHSSARALARIYGALARGGEIDGVRVLSRESVARCAEVQSEGEDLVLGVTTRFGLGFMLPQAHDPFARPGSFGHPGAGGALGFADPEARVGFGYVMNRMGVEILTDPRAQSLADAVLASLA